MIRAFILSMLYGTNRWEVRSISLKSGKDIPGERKFKGTYWQARKFFLNHSPKYCHVLRLQATVAPKVKIGDERTPKEVFDEVADKAKWDDEEKEAYAASLSETDEVIADQARQNETMRRLVDEPNVDVETEPDHECDAAGPLDWDEIRSAYAPTCSICGKPS